MTTETVKTIWDAGIEVGRSIYRAYSEDRCDERDQRLLEAWSAMIRELLSLPLSGEQPTPLAPKEWDAMAPKAKATACEGKWFDFQHFTLVVCCDEVVSALRSTRRN